jgi:hypothetical protein
MDKSIRLRRVTFSIEINVIVPKFGTIRIEENIAFKGDVKSSPLSKENSLRSVELRFGILI